MKISKKQLISDLNYLLIRLDKKYSIEETQNIKKNNERQRR